jgi:hypothetical protein
MRLRQARCHGLMLARTRSVTCCLASLVTLSLLAPGARAGLALDTVNWAASAGGSGTGTGTLDGGTITVSYSSISGGNSGATDVDDWTASLATSAAVSSVTNKTAGVYASASSLSPVTQTINFSAAVTNPFLLVDYTDSGTTYDFGSLTLRMFSGNNAMLSGSVVTFPGSGGDLNSGFIAQIIGTFGPGAPLTFTDSTGEPFNPDAFTIGVSSVPEPSTFGMAISGAIGVISYRRRRRNVGI